MAEIKLDAQMRETTGKGSARRARRAGKVPAILYGNGIDSRAIEVDRRELITAFHTDAGTNILLDLQIDGESTLAITRELQRDPIKGTVLHADFVKIDRAQAIEVDVPVHLVGESPGAKEGGVLEQPLFQVHIRCLPTDVPQHVEADISSLQIGEQLRVGDLSVPQGIEVIDDPETVVAAVAQPISEAEMEAMEAGAGIEQEAPEAAEAAAEAADASVEASEESADRPDEGKPDAAQE